MGGRDVPVEVRRATADDLGRIAVFADDVVHDTYDRLVGREYATALRRDWWSATLAESVERGLVHVAVAGDDVDPARLWDPFSVVLRWGLIVILNKETVLR